MEAVYINNNFTSRLTLKEVMESFFRDNTPESAKVLFWKLLQCWALKDCKIKAQVSDEEIALFFDQLIDLVGAVYVVHQANGALLNSQEGDNNE
ncbi:hypothetical protein ACFFGT_02850 [Mucilaginibacter angelicae]|uniref:Uncharacterized protein n=1 Tax=Mucilaginibacter angelicae TaxID=869718 RepID=A0ABV6L0D0_9SPHI